MFECDFFYQNMSNLLNQYKSAKRKISNKNPEDMLNYLVSCSLFCLEINFQNPCFPIKKIYPKNTNCKW